VLEVELEAFSVDELDVELDVTTGGGMTVELEVELDVFSVVVLDVVFVIGGGITVLFEVELVVLRTWQLAHLI